MTAVESIGALRDLAAEDDGMTGVHEVDLQCLVIDLVWALALRWKLTPRLVLDMFWKCAPADSMLREIGLFPEVEL